MPCVNAAGVAPADERDAFARQPRASGGSRSTVAARGGRHAGATRVYEDGLAARALSRTPRRELEAVIVNTAGGIAGGDRFDLDIAVGAGRARSSVTTAAAEKVYRSLGPDARDRRASSRSAPARTLAWLPQETILFDRARLARTHRRRARRGRARCCWPRPWCSAARPWARRWTRARCSTAGACAATAGWSSPRPCGSTARSRDKLARAGGRRRRRRDRDRADRARRRGHGRRACARCDSFRGEVGVSAWNGLAVARLCAKDGAALRRDLVAVLDGARRRRCRGSG